jgi:RHS repeat-associated protein
MAHEGRGLSMFEPVRHGVWRIRTLRLFVVAGVLACLAGAVSSASAAVLPRATSVVKPVAPKADAVTGVTKAPVKKLAVNQDAKTPYKTTATALPAASTGRAELATSASSGTSATSASSGTDGLAKSTVTGPVWAQRVAANSGPGTVTGSVASQTTAKDLGISGVVFDVAGSGASGKVRVGLNYSAFADAYGGDFGTRLQLYTLPACALTTPDVAACRVRTPVTGAVNDEAGKSLSGVVNLAAAASASTTGTASPSLSSSSTAGVAKAAVAAAASSSSVVLAASAGTGEEGSAAGNYSASAVAPDGSWTAGGSSGDFTYDYSITTPDSSSSLTPSVALDYDSGSVDGKTSMTNAQASDVGDGWAAPADNYITQTFVPCNDDPEGSASGTSTDDMCYDGEVLTLSLNGSSTTIVDDGGTFKLQNDNGAVITHVTDSDKGQGTYNTDYWEITERDGTTYYFGMNELPGYASKDTTTNSVDWEPVYSAHSGDPCYNATWSDAVCDMAYEWHLDYVTNTHADAMAYYYTQATNYYGEDNGASDKEYVRDSYLNEIDYGFTTGTGPFGTIPDKVLFTNSNRCVASTCATLSSSLSTTTAADEYPDIPTDLLCASGAKCTSYAPSFFSSVRLTAITTEQYSASAAAYKDVDSYALTQDFPATGDSTSGTLWLESVQHTGDDTSGGGSSSAITEPEVSFSGTDLPNRLNTTTYPGLYRWRIDAVTGELGSVTNVTYTIPDACSTSTSPSDNTTSCYPVYWTPTGYSAPIEDWFIKYAVSEVQVEDETGGNLATVTDYTYASPAWHYDDDPATQAKYRTWGQFRGYGTVTTLDGDGVNNAQSKSTTSYYQGMYGDYLTSSTTSTTTVTDSQGGVHDDYDELAGEPLETTAYLGDGGAIDNSTIYSYWVSGATASQTLTGLPAVTSNMAEVAETWTRQRTTDGNSIGWNYTETDDTYDTGTSDTNFGLLEYSYSHADNSTALNDAAYNSCTMDTYAPGNTSLNIVGLAATKIEVSTACGGFTEGSPTSVPNGLNTLTAPTFTQAQVVSAVASLYDVAVPSFASSETVPQTSTPTIGDTTVTLEASAYSGSAFTWVPQSEKTYDAYGRTEDSYDADGHETITSYTVADGLTTAESVENALDETSSETLDPTRSLELTSTDDNGVVTTKQYDALGRVTAVWLASRATSADANYLYLYTESDTAVSGTETETLNAELGYSLQVTLEDSLGRTIQMQASTPAGGMLVTDEFYNSLGQVSKKYNSWWDSGTTPSITLVTAAEDQMPNEDVYTYDGLGNQVEDVSEQDAEPVSTTYTVYSGDATTVIPPTGGVTKTTVTDPLGRTTAVEEYSVDPTLTIPSNINTGVMYITGGTTLTTSYGYDGHGNEATTTDADGETWTNVYNLLGQITEKEDPTGGDSYMAYDNQGNLTQSEDSRGEYLSYTYDALNRKTGEYASTSTGQLAGASGNQLSAWYYDNTNDGYSGMQRPDGHLTTEISYANGNAYTEQYKGFTAFGDSTGEIYTITDGAGDLAGTYTYLHTYSAYTGILFDDIYYSEASGALPAETVVHAYTSILDLPDTLAGNGGYAQYVQYDAYSRVSQEEIGSGTYGEAWITDTYDVHTGKLKEQLVTRGTDTPEDVDDTTYTYDLDGNITQETEERLGSTADEETQCYIYNALDQLTTAWTATDACATVPSTTDFSTVGNTLGTNSAYWDTWTYNNEGDRLTQDQHSLTSPNDDTLTSYTYSTTQLHTLTSTTTTVNGSQTASTGYKYDTAGDTTQRVTSATGTQTLTWNAAGELTQVVSTTAGTTSYVYDADGNLLVQSTPTAVTLYIEGEELTYTDASAAYSGIRYYTLPGGGTAVRTGADATDFSFEVDDQQSTNDLYLDYTAQDPTWRQYDPFGNARGTAVDWIDNRGFLNDVTDATTGLTDIGARWYDPAIGRFTSLDPVFESTDNLALGGYAYTDGNPVTEEDPSGDMLMTAGGCAGSIQACGQVEQRQQQAQQKAAQQQVQSDENKAENNALSACGGMTRCFLAQSHAWRDSDYAAQQTEQYEIRQAVVGAEEQQNLAAAEAAASSSSCSGWWSCATHKVARTLGDVSTVAGFVSMIPGFEGVGTVLSLAAGALSAITYAAGGDYGDAALEATTTVLSAATGGFGELADADKVADMAGADSIATRAVQHYNDLSQTFDEGAMRFKSISAESVGTIVRTGNSLATGTETAITSSPFESQLASFALNVIASNPVEDQLGV